MIRRLLSVLFLAIAAISMSACSMKTVPAGNVGVKVYLLGSEKGVDHEVVGTGRYFLGINTDMYLFPTFTQNYTWTHSTLAGDESITFNTIEGMEVNGDIGISYHINPDKVSNIFQKYRRGVDEITDVFLRNMVRDALVKRGAALTVEEAYGKGKAKLIEDVQRDVAEQVEDIGIVVEKVYLIGSLRLPDKVIDGLNEKILATQKAQQRENEIATSKAEAEKEVAKAEGQAKAALTVARAEAESMRIKGEALRSNPELATLAAIEKWNGVLPVATGGSVPLIDVSKIAAAAKSSQ